MYVVKAGDLAVRLFADGDSASDQQITQDCTDGMNTFQNASPKDCTNGIYTAQKRFPNTPEFTIQPPW